MTNSSDNFNFMDFAMGISMASLFSKILEKSLNSAVDQMDAATIKLGEPSFNNLHNTKYIYAIIDGKQIGPISFATMVEWIEKGFITHETYIWKPGMIQWEKAKNVNNISPDNYVFPPKFNG